MLLPAGTDKKMWINFETSVDQPIQPTQIGLSRSNGPSHVGSLLSLCQLGRQRDLSLGFLRKEDPNHYACLCVLQNGSMKSIKNKIKLKYMQFNNINEHLLGRNQGRTVGWPWHPPKVSHTHTHTKTKWFLLLPLTNTSLIFADNSSDLPVDLIIEKTAPKSCYHNKQVGCWFDLWVQNADIIQFLFGRNGFRMLALYESSLKEKHFVFVFFFCFFCFWSAYCKMTC